MIYHKSTMAGILPPVNPTRLWKVVIIVPWDTSCERGRRWLQRAIINLGFNHPFIRHTARLVVVDDDEDDENIMIDTRAWSHKRRVTNHNCTRPSARLRKPKKKASCQLNFLPIYKFPSSFLSSFFHPEFLTQGNLEKPKFSQFR